MMRYKNIFEKTRLAVIGLIHVGALPGTPLNKLTMNKLVDNAVKEAEIYKSADINGVIVENMWDIPYVKSNSVGPEITACMTRVAAEVRKTLPTSIPCGIQILAGGNKEALSVCKASELQFMRCEGFIFSHVADEGWIDACGGDLLRFRKYLDCEHVRIFVDIKKKHCSHAVTGDLSIEEIAKAAEFFLADGVVLTGSATGMEADSNDLKRISEATTLPIFIGSGVTGENISKFSEAHGLIVGSHFKTTGKWFDCLDAEKVLNFMKTVKQLRKEIENIIKH